MLDRLARVGRVSLLAYALGVLAPAHAQQPALNLHELAAAIAADALAQSSAYGPSGSEWGCGVLLCLAASGAAPQGCPPYLTRLWRILSKVPPDPFPTCAIAGTGNYARQVPNPYPLCDEGLQETTGWVATPSEVQNAWFSADTRTRTQMVIRSYQQDAWLASGETRVPGEHGYESELAPKACVSGYISAYEVPQVCDSYGGDAGEVNCRGGYTVRIFDRVDPLPPRSPRAIDVYIDGQIYNRVHW